MAYSSTSSSSSTHSDVSNDSNCCSSCLECVKYLKEQNEQLVKDLRTARISVVSYKTSLESVEARLVVFKKNKSVYEEDIKLLKREIYLRDLDITELKRKLELATKEKDEVQLTVQKFENSSKSLSKILDSQKMDKCKIGIGYNAIPPPYTRNFMPPKHDLVYPSLDDFVDESVSESIVEKSTVEINEPKTARKENEAPIIEDWVSDSNEENVPKVKTVEMFNKSSFAKINFVKSTKQVKSPRKTSVDKNRQTTPSPRGNKSNWNQNMSQKLGSDFEMFNKACHMCGSFDHLKNDCNHRSGPISLNTTKPVNTIQPRTAVNNAGPMKNVINNAYSTDRRPFNKITATNNFTKKVNTVKGTRVNTARPKETDPILQIMKTLMEDLLPLEVIPKEGKLLGKSKTCLKHHETNFGCPDTSLNNIDHLGNRTNSIAGITDNIVAGQAQKEKELEQEYILIPLCTTAPLISQGSKHCEGDVGMKPTEVDENEASDKSRKHDQEARSESESTPVSTAGPSFDTVVPSTPVNTVGPSVSTANESEEQLFERFSPFKNA
ncbi:hypothetical protein Tco_1108147 [Tanacetum coccineum]